MRDENVKIFLSDEGEFLEIIPNTKLSKGVKFVSNALYNAKNYAFNPDKAIARVSVAFQEEPEELKIPNQDMKLVKT